MYVQQVVNLQNKIKILKKQLKYRNSAAFHILAISRLEQMYPTTIDSLYETCDEFVQNEMESQTQITYELAQEIVDLKANLTALIKMYTRRADQVIKTYM